MVKQNSVAYVLVNHLRKTRHKLASALHKPIAIQEAIATGLCTGSPMEKRLANATSAVLTGFCVPLLPKPHKRAGMLTRTQN